MHRIDKLHMEFPFASSRMPEIFKTDQGSQFTGSTWITTLTDAAMRISMDGRGRYLPSHRFCETTTGQWINIFIERLWHYLKQEANYHEEITEGF